jgi:hypothetical protein
MKQLLKAKIKLRHVYSIDMSLWCHSELENEKNHPMYA